MDKNDKAKGRYLPGIVKSLRIHQWIKNFFVFAPLLFGRLIADLPSLSSAAGAFFCFCLISSGVYLINDILDLERDRAHPIKSKRPLVQGEIEKSQVAFSSVFLLAISLGLAYVLSLRLFAVGILYVLLNLGYSYRLKKVIIIDVIAIALGFELRVWAGAVAVNIVPSLWLQMCTLVLALFLGFCKRKKELVHAGGYGAQSREVLADYTPKLLDELIIISAGLAIICYGLYAITMPRDLSKISLIYTMPFVIYGIFRYLYLLNVKGEVEDTSRLLIKDLPSMFNLILWTLMVAVVIYA